ncbi:MAG: beta-glycosidase, partial [Bacteroidales bacterium]|nr:beta-glycosidase [Bacteroidales bacterium]
IKKACEPLHIQYNPVSRDVEVVNICCGSRKGLVAEATVYNLAGEQVGVNSSVVDIENDSTTPCFKADLPDESVCFLKLRLLDADGAMVSENTYVIAGSTGNLKSLRALPAAILTKTVKVSGEKALVTVRNSDSVPALLVRLVLTDRRGEEILPVEYADNYFALMAGEEKTVEISWGKSGFSGSPEVHLQQMGYFSRSESANPPLRAI